MILNKDDKENMRLICDVCNKELQLLDDDYFMLKDNIWLSVLKEYQLENKGGTFVCLHCVEYALSRPLTKDDITDSFINRYENKTMAKLLTDGRANYNDEDILWIRGFQQNYRKQYTKI